MPQTKSTIKNSTYVWLLWTPFVALNGSKNSGETDTKYVSGAIYFWFQIRPGPTLICKL